MLMCYTQIFLLDHALTSSRCYFEDQILETEFETSLTFRIDIWIANLVCGKIRRRGCRDISGEVEPYKCDSSAQGPISTMDLARKKPLRLKMSQPPS
jgi:hypothetical protein